MNTKFSNPVLMKEIKLRFRSPKSFVGILFYLAAMSLFVFGFLYLMTTLDAPGTGGGFLNTEESFILFTILTYIQLALVLFITPGLTAGSISSEREKQTLNMLLTTTQTSFQIILGKLLSSIAFLALMIVSSLPIYSLVFLFGGISPAQLALMLFYFLLTTLAIGSVGVMFSTLIRKTAVAMIATYGTMLALTAGPGFLSVFSASLVFAGPSAGPSPMAHFWASINPAVVVASLLSPGSGNILSDMTGIEFPVWIIYLIFYTSLIILSVFIAVKKLRVNMKAGN